jgi:hypothetical protein
LTSMPYDIAEIQDLRFASQTAQLLQALALAVATRSPKRQLGMPAGIPNE